MARPVGKRHASPAHRVMSDEAQGLRWPAHQSTTNRAKPQNIDLSAGWDGSVTRATERHKVCHFARGFDFTVGGCQHANSTGRGRSGRGGGVPAGRGWRHATGLQNRNAVLRHSRRSSKGPISHDPEISPSHCHHDDDL